MKKKKGLGCNPSRGLEQEPQEATRRQYTLNEENIPPEEEDHNGKQLVRRYLLRGLVCWVIEICVALFVALPLFFFEKITTEGMIVLALGMTVLFAASFYYIAKALKGYESTMCAKCGAFCLIRSGQTLECHACGDKRRLDQGESKHGS